MKTKIFNKTIDMDDRLLKFGFEQSTNFSSNQYALSIPGYQMGNIWIAKFNPITNEPTKDNLWFVYHLVTGKNIVITDDYLNYQDKFLDLLKELQ